MKRGFVYILASGRNSMLYIGATSALSERIQQHRDGVVDGFTKRYGVHRLVHVETFDDIRDAIARERQLKKWNRAWKLELIEKHNPKWDDLSDFLQRLGRLRRAELPTGWACASTTWRGGRSGRRFDWIPAFARMTRYRS